MSCWITVEDENGKEWTVSVPWIFVWINSVMVRLGLSIPIREKVERDLRGAAS